MKKYAQILYGKAHWIFEAEEMPDYGPDIILVEITNKPEVKEGWDYNPETGGFTAPVLSEPSPGEPIEPQDSPIQKVERLESIIEQQNLTILDVNLSLYEEILALREEVSQLKSTNSV